MNGVPDRLYRAVAVILSVPAGRTHRLSQDRLSLLSERQLAMGPTHMLAPTHVMSVAAVTRRA